MSTYEDDHNITNRRNNTRSIDHPTRREYRLRHQNQLFSSQDNEELNFRDSINNNSNDILNLINVLSNMADNSNNTLPTANYLIDQLHDILNDDTHNFNNKGVSQEFIDSLERISKKKLKTNDSCSICRNDFLNDPYPLIVKLNNCDHIFDLECIGPWLKINPTCPMCRKNVNEKRTIELPTKSRNSNNNDGGDGEDKEDEEDEEDDGMNMYG
ncbi:uncharacterized protein ASCRUDRAFT_41685 [Ascoidea rubescens DSM 1968]|uniref:RING-type domain-containing protein n=1 Tax=Ascoidea rubescens DSM 1968 TaxID=1344418 RepID=A0A1D2VQS8_9ASCO|nr:hypothetical protein ASCRUDRAFT_41685 [Ascoidea rubescens DSM 1968]ODV63938.1 hypothetical protein ASCRUDRAFT_41685 [Ascoidea rubescens DSM 1968]